MAQNNTVTGRPPVEEVLAILTKLPADEHNTVLRYIVDVGDLAVERRHQILELKRQLRGARYRMKHFYHC